MHLYIYTSQYQYYIHTHLERDHWAGVRCGRSDRGSSQWRCQWSPRRFDTFCQSRQSPADINMHKRVINMHKRDINMPASVYKICKIINCTWVLPPLTYRTTGLEHLKRHNITEHVFSSYTTHSCNSGHPYLVATRPISMWAMQWLTGISGFFHSRLRILATIAQDRSGPPMPGPLV